jgi:hypothetical protein
VKQLSVANENLIDRTIELWQPRLWRELSREDARQIVENVTGFFSLLSQWSKYETAAPASDGRSFRLERTADDGEVRHEG